MRTAPEQVMMQCGSGTFTATVYTASHLLKTPYQRALDRIARRHAEATSVIRWHAYASRSSLTDGGS